MIQLFSSSADTEKNSFGGDYLITSFTSLGSPNWQTHLSTSPLFPTLNSGAHWLQAEVQMKGGKTIMLIFNDEQRLRAGIKSLSKRCPYCSKALAAYPLILSDDAGLFVYHAACAAALATEILVDLYTFFRPPEPYHQLFVLDPIRAAPKHPAGRERKELTHAMVNGYPPD